MLRMFTPAPLLGAPLLTLLLETIKVRRKATRRPPALVSAPRPQVRSRRVTDSVKYAGLSSPVRAIRERWRARVRRAGKHQIQIKQGNQILCHVQRGQQILAGQ